MPAIRILIADDHSVVSEGLRFMLEAQGDMQVVGLCENGREAVKQAIALQPDVAIMDISMAEMNGIEATRAITRKAPSVKVLMLSMHSNAEHVRRAFQNGASGYMVKSSAGREILDAVRAVHAGRRFISARLAEMLIDGFTNPVQEKNPLDSLSAREREVMQMYVEGKSINDIARLLSLSPRTVETYRGRILEKLEIPDITGLVKFAIQQGITSVD